MPQIRLELQEEVERLVEEAAAAEGLSVAAYVQDAVVLRLLATMRGRGDTEAQGLLDHLRATAREPTQSQADPSVASVIDDPERLDAVHRTGLLDSPPEETFDRLVRLAADALAAPAATISLVDDKRQYFKSRVRLPDHLASVGETPLSHSVCQYAVGTGEPVIVEDARDDRVLSRVASVMEGDVVAYIGIPLMDASGHALGTLCVWDSRPREWTRGHVQILEDLARMAAQRIPTDRGDTPPPS